MPDLQLKWSSELKNFISPNAMNNLSSLANRYEESLKMQNIFTSSYKIWPDSSSIYQRLPTHPFHCPYWTPHYLPNTANPVSKKKSLLNLFPLGPSLTFPWARSMGAWADLHGWLYTRIMKPLQLTTQTQYHNVGQLVHWDGNVKLI